VVAGRGHDADLPSFLTGPLCLLVEGTIAEGTARGFAAPARAGRTAASMLLSVYETHDAS
jgi:hypothetical protein